MLYNVYVRFMLLSWVVGSILGQSSDDPSRNVIISLAPGQELKGLQTTSVSGSNVSTFYGIPYALPPTGTHRFKQPEAPPDWTGVKDATTKSAICRQFSRLGDVISGSEDCLYLNVFTPDVNASLPVFVWIHGGGFRLGSAWNDGDGATIAPHGVVVVTINYRLGALGFLSTTDDIMPGNYGMLDQVLALKWVQKYIRAFGGDPSQVTIGGESTGAFSVSTLILSPLAKGLFKRAVSESGSAVSIAAIARPVNEESVKNSTLRSAARLGCNKVTSSEILECLQKVDVDLLLNATRDAGNRPRVETVFGFLPDDPIDLLKGGAYNRVDTLQGTNSGEGSEWVHDPENDGVSTLEFTDAINQLTVDYVHSDEIVNLVVQAYVGNETDPLRLRAILVHAITDILLVSGALFELHTFVSDVTSTTKHFFYEFDYRISDTSTPAWQGVLHAAERRFVFYPDNRYTYATQTDKDVATAVQNLWVNFIKYGDPTPSNITQAGTSTVSWSAFTKNSPNILIIDANSTLITFPRPFLLPLHEQILEIVEKKGPVVC